MTRLVLLGLDDEDVDVLSRIPKLNPPPEVVVVHPDPDALIAKLAGVAEHTVQAEPPPARADDVVVTSGEDPRLDPWKGLGAQIVAPVALSTSVISGQRKPPSREERAGAREPEEFEVVVSSRARSPARKGPPTEGEPVFSTRSKRGEKMQSRAGQPSQAERSLPKVSWENPEGPLRALAKTLGPEGESVTLWWDGNVGVWVPWAWVGSDPGDAGDEEPGGVELSSEWGRFRVAGPAKLESAAAWTRVAEDLVLRDLLRWERRRSDLSLLGPLPATSDLEALVSWYGKVKDELSAHAALLWQQSDGGWTLLEAWGEETAFRGELLLPDSLLVATFEQPGSPWRSWGPVPEARFYFTVAPEDRRWPLRVHRLEQTLSLEGAD